MRFLLLPIAVLALAAPASAATSCGRLHGGFELDIVAVHLSCHAARDVVRAWHQRAVTQAKGPGSKYVGFYYCHSRTTDPEHVEVRCANGTKKVRFSAGP